MKNITEVDWNDKNICRASFLPYYVDENNEIWLIFGINTVSGNITDFGGMYEQSDKNFIYTAIREYKEECNELFGQVNLSFNTKVIISPISYHILFKVDNNPKYYVDKINEKNILSKELCKIISLSLPDVKNMIYKNSTLYSFTLPLKQALKNDIDNMNVQNLIDIKNTKCRKVSIVKINDNKLRAKIKIIKNKINKSLYDPNHIIKSENIRIKCLEVGDVNEEISNIKCNIYVQPKMEEIHVERKREWGIFFYYAARDDVLVFANEYMNVYIIRENIDDYVSFLKNFNLQMYSFTPVNRLNIKRSMATLVNEHHPEPEKVWSMLENIRNMDNLEESLIEEVKLVSTLEKSISKYQMSNDIPMYNIEKKLKYYDYLNEMIVEHLF